MKTYLIIAALMISMAGCNSFSTSTLTRNANDSVSVQPTNRKLKGLPVKLKVPSHLKVTVFEQQVILANSDTANNAAQEAKTAADAAVAAQRAVVEGLDPAVAAAEKSITDLESQKQKINTLLQEARQRAPAVAAEIKGFEESLSENSMAIANANRSLSDALANQAKKGDEQKRLDDLVAAQTVARDNATIQYTLLSFNPAQYVVETELQYTDKVFLVDFKRPAGGILNLTDTSFDHEQYFSDIQADVQEQTLADVSSALSTLNPLAENPGSTNAAIATSANSSDAESNGTVDFQNSVVATQRFDISDAGWEGRVQQFVNQYIQNQSVVEHSVGQGMPVQPPIEGTIIHSPLN